MHHPDEETNDDEKERFVDSLESSSIGSLDLDMEKIDFNDSQVVPINTEPIIVEEALIREHDNKDSCKIIEEEALSVQDERHNMDPCTNEQTKVQKNSRNFGTNTTPNLLRCTEDDDKISSERIKNIKFAYVEGSEEFQYDNYKFVHIQVNPNSDIKVILCKESDKDKEENKVKSLSNSEKMAPKIGDDVKKHPSRLEEFTKIPKIIPNFINLNKYQGFNFTKNKIYTQIDKNKKRKDKEEEDNSNKYYAVKEERLVPIDGKSNYSKLKKWKCKTFPESSTCRNLEQTGSIWKQKEAHCCNSRRPYTSENAEYRHSCYEDKSFSLMRDDCWIERSKYLQCLKNPAESKYSRKPPVKIRNIQESIDLNCCDENSVNGVKYGSLIQRKSSHFYENNSNLFPVGAGKEKHLVELGSPGFLPEKNHKNSLEKELIRENFLENKEKKSSKCYTNGYKCYKKLPKISNFREAAKCAEESKEQKKQFYKLRKDYGKRVNEINCCKYPK
ncbi:uncharacterized protein LOC111632258 [Centruroides sculpturatus]|uniref:uncharacterized protein LOC111632258 n=1 Tax=Centruroides sculpturatus TaxID=218467 RepID=UPI000C6DDBEF|nr:uncharacterized protein LOC111632258 [Centruroides sculpturatus]